MADAGKPKDLNSPGITCACPGVRADQGQQSHWLYLPGIRERIAQEWGWEAGETGGGCNYSLAIADQRTTSFDLDLAQQSTEHCRAIPIHGRPDHHHDWQHHTASLWLYTTWLTGSMVHSSTAFTRFSCCSFCLLSTYTKSIQVVRRSPARLTKLPTEMPMNTVLVILLCALSPSHFKSAWDNQATADHHQKPHQVTTCLAWISNLELCIHSRQYDWKNQETPEECVAASVNSPILLVKGRIFWKLDFPTGLLWFSKNNVLQYP